MSLFVCLQIGSSKYYGAIGARRAGVFLSLDRTPPSPRDGKTKKKGVPQNVDFPQVQPKNKKKPYPIPLKKILQAARAKG